MKIVFVFVILSLISCKKQKTFDFPIGNYKMIGYTFETIFLQTDVKAICNDINIDDLSYSFKFDGGDKLYFAYNNNFECFNIKSVKKNSETSLFELEDKEYVSDFKYEFTLRSKKGKQFLFEYNKINDSIYIGEFWAKNQKYHSFDAPNIGKKEYIKINSSTEYIPNLTNSTEILGVFKKIK